MDSIANQQEVELLRNILNIPDPDISPFNCFGQALTAMVGAHINKLKIPLVKYNARAQHLYILADLSDYGCQSSRGLLSFSRGVTAPTFLEYPEYTPEELQNYPDFRGEILYGTYKALLTGSQEKANILREHFNYFGLTANERDIKRRGGRLLLGMAQSLGILIVNI